jgi:hypothetical protein
MRDTDDFSEWWLFLKCADGHACLDSRRIDLLHARWIDADTREYLVHSTVLRHG